MTQEDIIKTRTDLLKAELSLLDAKMKSIVDRLWQMRVLCATIWAGLVAIGLGAGTGDRQPIPGVLWVSAFVPIWFAWIDSSYQRWYRRFRMREEAISLFFNGGGSHPHWKWGSFDQILQGTEWTFPVLDLSGHSTYGNDPAYAWRASRWSGLFDPTPLLAFGGLFGVSVFLCTLRSTGASAWLPLLIAFAMVVFVFGIGFWKRTSILGDTLEWRSIRAVRRSFVFVFGRQSWPII